MDFIERQRELCRLSSFIADQEKWLSSVLKKLQWTEEKLNSASPSVQCPYNANHYVPSSSLETHKVKCWYASQGVTVDANSIDMLSSKSAFYDSLNVPHVHIDHATQSAVLSLARQADFAGKSEQQCATSTVRSRVLEEKLSESLEDARSTPSELLSQQAHQIISYIKSWNKVPHDFISIAWQSLDLSRIKGWLFKNLPDKHVHSSSVGGEMVTVDTIVKWLTADSAQSITPNVLVKKLKPMLGTKSRSFVLDLWKYVNISKLQTEHGIEDSFVEDIVPLTAAVLLHQPEEKDEEAPSISERVKELLLTTRAQEKDVEGTSTLYPLPMDHVLYKLSTDERRTLYDYTVEVSSGVAGASTRLKDIDPDLYRDDAAALKAKLKAQRTAAVAEGEEERGNVWEQIKRKRDYRRRRQTYKAKNVHITRRTPKEIFRDIINNRMEEIAAAAASEAENKDSHESHGQQLDADKHDEMLRSNSTLYESETMDSRRRSRSPRAEKDRTSRGVHSKEGEYRRRESRGRRSQSRSPSDSRSRSKERHRKREKKHKKRRSRSRSRSRVRSSKRKKRKHHHSRSKSPSKDR